MMSDLTEINEDINATMAKIEKFEAKLDKTEAKLEKAEARLDEAEAAEERSVLNIQQCRDDVHNLRTMQSDLIKLLKTLFASQRKFPTPSVLIAF